MNIRNLLGMIFALFLVACAGEPVVSDISQDKVILQGNGASPALLQSKADESCAMYKKRAQPLSQRCGDQYCIQKYYLFACRE